MGTRRSAGRSEKTDLLGHLHHGRLHGRFIIAMLLADLADRELGPTVSLASLLPDRVLTFLRSCPRRDEFDTQFPNSWADSPFHSVLARFALLTKE